VRSAVQIRPPRQEKSWSSRAFSLYRRFSPEGDAKIRRPDKKSPGFPGLFLYIGGSPQKGMLESVAPTRKTRFLSKPGFLVAGSWEVMTTYTLEVHGIQEETLRAYLTRLGGESREGGKIFGPSWSARITRQPDYRLAAPRFVPFWSRWKAKGRKSRRPGGSSGCGSCGPGINARSQYYFCTKIRARPIDTI
jgi:hypothetical protein